MLPGYIAYRAARRAVESTARSALPNAPVQSSVQHVTASGRLKAIRAGLSDWLRQVADRLDPAPGCPPAASAHRR